MRLFVRTLHTMLLTLEAQGVDRPVQKHVKNKMANLEASVHPVKNCLSYHFAIYATSEVVYRDVQEG